MRVYSRGELGKVLLATAIVGGVVVVAATLPGLAIIYKMLDAKSAKDRYRVNRTLKNLEKKGLVIRCIKNGNEKLVVTPQGQKQLHSYLQEDLVIKQPKEWDGIWRVLMFDIPEEKRRVRQEVSWKIKDIGMKAIQNSVFINPYPCKPEIDKVIKHYNVQKFFIYFEANTYEGVENLKKIFKLP